MIQLQEEIENRTVNLVVSTTRLTARTLMHALQKYLNSIERQKIAKKSEKRQIKMTRVLEKEKQKAREKLEGPHGKQTVKQLLRSGKEIRRLPVQETHLREFEKVIKKYGVDFAVNKGVFEGQSRYLVFFKAKDESVLSDVYKECLAKQLHKEKAQEKKPSVLKSLAHFKEIAAKTPQKMQKRELVR